MEKEKIPQKVEAMYEAVLELLEEGEDLHNMKVSAITNRAGIGKGTAYEYFQSKEEMLVGAVLYGIDRKIEELDIFLGQAHTMKDKIMSLFTWLSTQYGKERCFIKFIGILRGSYEAGKKLEELIQEKRQKKNQMLEIFRKLGKAGQAEQVFGADISDSLLILAMEGKALSYISYLENPETFQDFTEEQMREKLYEGLCKELS